MRRGRDRALPGTGRREAYAGTVTDFPDLSDFPDAETVDAETAAGKAPDGADPAGQRQDPLSHLGAHLGARLCARVGCGRDAEATLTADYGDRMMAVGPLSPERTPPALDLCAAHRDALRPPAGWTIIEHDPSREPR